MTKNYEYYINGKPILQWQDNGKWTLIEDFCYGTPDGEFFVPAGLLTDFASIPKGLKMFFSVGAVLSRSALVHDWLYSSCSVSRKKADITFRELLKIEGVNFSTRHLFYWGVRLFGAGHYKKCKVIITEQ